MSAHTKRARERAREHFNNSCNRDCCISDANCPMAAHFPFVLYFIDCRHFISTDSEIFAISIEMKFGLYWVKSWHIPCSTKQMQQQYLSWTLFRPLCCFYDVQFYEYGVQFGWIYAINPYLWFICCTSTIKSDVQSAIYSVIFPMNSQCWFRSDPFLSLSQS